MKEELRYCKECGKKIRIFKEQFSSEVQDVETGKWQRYTTSSTDGKMVKYYKGKIGSYWLCDDCYQLYVLPKKLKEIERQKERLERERRLMSKPIDYKPFNANAFRKREWKKKIKQAKQLEGGTQDG